MIQQSPILCREDYPDEQLEFVRKINTNNSPPEQILMKSQEADDEKLKLDNSSNYTKTVSKPTSIVQYFHIRHFAKRLMKYKRYLSMFTKDHYDAINDRASALDIEMIKQHGSKLKPLISTAMIKQSAIYTSLLRMANTYYKIQDKFIAKLPLVDPDSQVKLYWDCLLLIPRIYFMIIIPMDLAWIMNQFLYDTFIIPTVLSLLLLIMDTFFRLCQSFYMNGQLITSRFQIFLHVLTRAAGIEITSLIIQITYFIQAYYYDDQINVNKDLHYLLLLLTCVQHYNINSIRQALEDTLNLSKVALSIIELLKLLFLVCYVIHLFACIWFWVGQYSDLYLGQSWINNANRNLTDLGFGQQYLYSFYFSTVTMFTVGYGDITPQSYPEILVSIIFMMICSIQLSYSVNTIGGIIERISASKQEKMKAFHIINQYMQKNKISYLLQYQIRDYINYYITESQNQATDEENQIIDMLSTNLKNKLVTEANSAMIKSVPLFKDFSQQFIQAILTSIKSITLPPESIIDFSKLINHKSNNFCICQISSGKIISYVENTNSKQELSVLGTLNQGEYFGLTQFILNKLQQERYKTQSFTKLLFLARRDFIRVLADYPEVKLPFLLLLNDQSFDKTNYIYQQNAIAKMIKSYQSQRVAQINKFTKYILNISNLHHILELFFQYLLVSYSRIPIIAPTSMICIILDCLSLLATLIMLIYLPIEVFFNMHEQSITFNYGFMAILFLEIIMKFNVGFYQEGQIINNRLHSAVHYLNENFMGDIITLILLSQYFNWFRLFFLIRIFKLDVYFIKLIFIFRLNQIFLNISNLLRLCYIIIFSANLIGCIWYGLTYLNEDHNWLGANPYLTTKKDFYIESLYWAVTTMLTVGYGDALPQNNMEKEFAMLAMLFGCCLFAYIMGSIGNFVGQINAKHKERMKQTTILEIYLQNKPVSIEIKNKIRLSYQYHFSDDYENLLNGQEFLNDIPSYISQEYYEQVVDKLILQNTVFSQFPHKIIYQLKNVIQQIILLPNDSLLSSNQLYLVESGCIQHDILSMTFETYARSQIIQIAEFFTGQSPHGSYKAVQISSLYCLDRQAFLKLIQQSFDGLEYFCFIKDSLDLYQEQNIIKQSCSICGQEKHTAIQCEKLHFNINKVNFILRIQRSQQQTRQIYQRNQRRKYKFEEVAAMALLYIESNVSIKTDLSIEYNTSSNNIDYTPTPDAYSKVVHSNDRPSIQVKQDEDSIHLIGKIGGDNTPDVKVKRWSKGLISPNRREKRQTCVQTHRTPKIEHEYQPMYFAEFEKAASYVTYFPHNNFDRIIFTSARFSITETRKTNKSVHQKKNRPQSNSRQIKSSFQNINAMS